MILVIDPGHGGDNLGCQQGGLVEKHLTLALALSLRTLARTAGLQVHLTRERDEYLPLSVRGRRSQAVGATQVLALHFDTNANARVGSMTSYLLPDDRQSHGLSQAIAAATPDWLRPHKQIHVAPEGWKQNAYNVVHAHAAPTLLVECAFLSNHIHAFCLRRERMMASLAASLLAGILTWA